MPKYDPEQLARSLAQHRPPICDRIGARHTAHPELLSLARQNRQEKIRILEEAAQKATGSNLRDLRASLARNRKNTQEALSRLRADSASHQPAIQPAPAAKMFRSLKSLGGRTLPFTGQSSF